MSATDQHGEDNAPGDIEELPGASVALQPWDVTDHAERRDGAESWSGPERGVPRTWRQDLARWLATLNPGRTQREYEKAVSYFFSTPGVPWSVADITFDLLLAYRGALALRAMPHHERPARHPQSEPSRRERITEPERQALPGAAAAAGGGGEGAGDVRDVAGPLAPATVNVRLTALRQFLCYCALFGALPHLTPDRIRAALKRLSIERRRPYQVLAEPEWESFLLAARAPADGGHGPSASRRSRAGLTGARTAQRDHALLALALATGLRAVELASLDLGDLSREWHAGEEEWWLVLPDAKTKGQRGGRTLPLAPALIQTLLAYVETTGRSWERASDRAMPLFLSEHGRRSAQDAPDHPNGAARRLSPAHIRLIVDRVESQWRGTQHGAEEADGEARAISPHALRHSTALALLEGNTGAGRPPASVEHVRGWLGHFDIRTTQGYLAHLDARRTRRPFALNPRGAETHPSTPPAGSSDAAGRTEPPDADTNGVEQLLPSGSSEPQ